MKEQEFVVVSRKVPKQLDDMVLAYKEKTGISCNRIYEEALKEYLKGKV